jgi:IS5 family transposase
MRNWRVGIEARISQLKRGFGCGAPGSAGCRRQDLGGLGIFTYNLQPMTVLAA